MFSSPPKTTLENYLLIPHLELVLLWFIKNDSQAAPISNPVVKDIFKEGVRPPALPHHFFDALEAATKKNGQNLHSDIIERYVTLRTWMDMEAVKKISTSVNIQIDEAFQHTLNFLGRKSQEAIIDLFNFTEEKGISIRQTGIKEMIEACKTPEDQKSFKKLFLSDTILAIEIRLMAWVYKELFKKDFIFST